MAPAPVRLARADALAGVKAAWNPDDPRLLSSKTYGWGLGVNAYDSCTR